MSLTQTYSADIDSLLSPAEPGRLSAWAQLGTSVATAGSGYDALVTAGLAGWNIRKLTQSGTSINANGVTTIKNPDKVMLIYTDPETGEDRYLSTVGKNYGVHQNEAGAHVIDALVKASRARGIGYAGSIDDGRKTFVTIELPGIVLVDGADAIQLHLVAFNSHDGETAFRVMIVPFRPFCANQLNIALRDQVSSVTIKHTSKSAIDPEKIAKELGPLYAYGDAFAADARQMLRTEMTRREFDDLIREVWPVEDDAGPRTLNNARRRNEHLIRLWSSAETQAPIRGTRWAAFQAVTEYLDHVSPAGSLDIRAKRVLDTKTFAERKQNAYDLLLS
ncbi:DUF945 domain-containing protein [Amycolatopsis roodepoortensis]|uniref:DUF932 domain-containing protein n=1 Tax=Amycolatopsis roodepoortensis TaxID=700274 RepID=UPI00214CFFF4|nr:DUF932 domain-containing protein [Amycolatopsis roodepoortensis]UUV32125.1 DUF945 domain-containing protein [Amycolatopsis roodepoortensis]